MKYDVLVSNCILEIDSKIIVSNKNIEISNCIIPQNGVIYISPKQLEPSCLPENFITQTKLTINS